MADYNANTNWDNERTYLNNLINNGSSGEAAWAKGQMNVLENAYERYNSNDSSNDKVLASILDDSSQYFSQLYNLVNSSNAQAIELAERQNQFQVEQNAKAMEFNSAEAQKNRDFQLYMSNTAHSREIEDLKAAGLNPVLSAMGGNGASVGTGATAQGVTSAGTKADLVNNSLINLIGTMYQAKLNQQNAELSAKTALQSAQINAQASEYIAGVQAAASRYSADSNYAIQKSREEHDTFVQSHFPDTWQQLAYTLTERLFDNQLNKKDSLLKKYDYYNSPAAKDKMRYDDMMEMINALK